MCILRLTNDFIDDRKPRAKPHLRKVKPKKFKKPFFAPGWPLSIKLLGNLIVHLKLHLLIK